jgi:hypothetical protein
LLPVGQTPARAPGASVANLTYIRHALWWLLLVLIVSLVVFLPLLRYATDHYDTFSFRAFSRFGTAETGIAVDFWPVFFSNLLNGLLMFNGDNGSIWVHSLPGRPALDVVTGALFLLGLVLLIVRYVRVRDWRDLLLLLSIPILILPSVLSIAFPNENPALNRTGGAAVVVILISALALDGLVSDLLRAAKSQRSSGERRDAVRSSRSRSAWVASIPSYGIRRAWIRSGCVSLISARSLRAERERVRGPRYCRIAVRRPRAREEAGPGAGELFFNALKATGVNSSRFNGKSTSH